MVFTLDPDAGATLKFDSSLGVDNFEIRGSNTSPSAENVTETYDAALDQVDQFLLENLNENSLSVVSGGQLVFSHTGVTGELSTSYVYFSLPLNTTGEMQYKFWWNPPTDKKAGSDHYSAFYIVPFLDATGVGALPDRDVDTLRRNVDDNIYLRFGQDSDSGGVFTQLKFYNGDFVKNISVNAVSGNFYEVVLLINWETGAYRIKFDSEQVDSGTIPLIRISQLNPQHSYELFSASDETSMEEKYRQLAINRVGNVVVDENAVGVPVHEDDPLFGRAGSLEWVPITVNSPLMPKTDYIQYRLTFRSTGGRDGPVVTNVDFVPVVTLSGVEPGESESVWVRYNFPPGNSLSTNELNLKAWMRTDKL